MSSLKVNSEYLPTRPALVEAIEVAWQRLASAGTWWSGIERLAIVEQARAAADCSLCRQRKEALSPYAVNGEHAAVSHLCHDAVEAIHRLSTDASRCTERWVNQITAGDLSVEQYVEIVSIVATVSGLDTLDLALGRNPGRGHVNDKGNGQPYRKLPTPIDGEPTRHRPAGAIKDLAWVPTLSPQTVGPDDPNPFPLHGSINIHRAMSLVPQEVINFFDLDVELYLKDHEIRDFDHEFREISHAQIELIAGRASAINGCYY
ncbi:hypothetical protein AB833_02100 [Chromatiales bacterium (ex Bugula neritina AB1)]|nr:hypothetical protein AB833_02100 [Chromatiales bacterium (ex Bugula neritina AB1)]